ncbi:hypothetical protein LCGC14_0341030 [marine sediment metagenome]|uniref:Glycosyltransferase 2-like domain-containing protein n=1 Tax=marine sediment metagenome TaxID=412755 RepID=A0A0F9W0Z1_9ZZZZ
MPETSVIIVTYNRSEELKKCIKSVLAQSYLDYELIIVDDCSTDSTEDAVKEFTDKRIQYVKGAKNSSGSFVPRQVGQKVSSGKYIAVLDDDDFWLEKDKLKLQVEYLEKHPKCVLVGTNAVGIDSNGKVVLHVNYPHDDSEIRDRMLFRNLFYHSSVVYRRDAYLSCGGYQVLQNGHYGSYANEYDLWLRMGLVGGLANLPIYGVGHLSIVRMLSLKTRMSFMVQHLKDIKGYKSYYHHYYKAFIISVVFALLEIPVLVKMKRFMQRKLIR